MGPFCGDCLVEINGRPYCATCKQEQLLDVRSGVDRSQLNLASNWRRFAALLIDGFVTGIPIMVILAIVGFLLLDWDDLPFAWNLIGIPLSLVSFLYEGWMTSAKDGQTLGKMAVRIRIVSIDGSSITQGQVWGRAGMRLILGFCCALVDYLPAFFTAEQTTLHDMTANTRVVNTD